MRAVAVVAVLAACRWNFEPREGTSLDARPGDDASAGDDSALPPMRVYATSGAAMAQPRLLELDLATGEVVERGVLAYGQILSGLAYWDDSTLYATSVTGDLVEIDLATPAVVGMRAIGGIVSSLERDGADLIGIDEQTDELVRFTPTGALSRVPVRDTVGTVMAQGGDLARDSTGRWVWWSNSTMRPYELDVVTGVAEPLGEGTAGVFVGGLVFDRDDRLFVTSSIPDLILELDPADGTELARRTPCAPCPGTYDLQSGDVTRTP